MKVSSRFDKTKKIPRKRSSTDEDVNKNSFVIPFIKEKAAKIPKSERVSFTLRSDPANADSQTYEVTTAPFKWGKPEEWLNFVKVLNRILKGQNITRGADQFAMVRRLLDGQALSTFERAVTEQSLTETVANVTVALDEVTKDIFPHRALETQLRALRRYVKKPRDMSIMHMVARLTELNNQIPNYPDGSDNNKLGDDVLKEVVEWAIPKAWKDQMALQRFRIERKTLEEVIEFCKDMEQYEKSNPKPDRKESRKSTSTKRKRDTEFTAEKSTRFYCLYHGYGKHDSNKCDVLRNLAKRRKREQEFYEKKNSSKDKKVSVEQVHAIIKQHLSKDKARAARKTRKNIDKQTDAFSQFKIDSESEDDSPDASQDAKSETSSEDTKQEEATSSNEDDENSTSSDSTEENEFD